MRLSGTLSFYIGKRFLFSFLAFFIGLLAMILLLDSVELLRRAGSRADVTAGMVFEMALMKLPFMGMLLFPFATLFGGMLAFWRLTRSSELAITRASGISAWQFLLPALVIAISLGIAKVTIINPLAAVTLERFQQLEAVHLKGQKSFLALSGSGLWLRQGDAKGQSVIHARRILQTDAGMEISPAIFFLYEQDDVFIGRIDAESAVLKEGFWQLKDAWVSSPNKPAQMEPVYRIETQLTIAKIQDNFAPPETMSFWDLPAFIKTLEKAGFSAVRHRLHWHSLLASPLLMCAMVLIAATFTLRHARRGTPVYVIASGAMTGFLLYFITDVIYALGISESVPVALAAWTPSGVATLLGLAMLFHLEDG